MAANNGFVKISWLDGNPDGPPAPADYWTRTIKPVPAFLAIGTPPLNITGAWMRYLLAIKGGDRRLCAHCGNHRGVELESSRTCYPFQGTAGSPEDPNKPIPLCRRCALEHHGYWDEMWRAAEEGRL